MRILILSDGIPGHVNQARGLADWLRHSGRSVSVHEADCRLRFKWLRRPLAFSCNRLERFPTPARWILRCYRIQLPTQPADLIVSAGGNTSFANSVLARYWQCHNIFIGSLRHLSCKNFSALLTLEAVAGSPPNNLVMDFAPARVGNGRIEPNRWALLLGGDGSGYRYRRQDWTTLLRWARECAEENDIRWIVAGSRRSPGYLRQLCDRHLPESFVAASCWPGDSSPSLADTIPSAERIFCTEDSMTMLSESINLARPLTSLRPQSVSMPDRYRWALEKFEDMGLIERVAIGELNAGYRSGKNSGVQEEIISAAHRRLINQLWELIHPQAVKMVRATPPTPTR
ncbi:ELM1/GtrOC1 family putative glycosyltransferase [Microbulbifer rhizosphaerae]|uniref:Fission protein ELM1 n=1 Tax=Microbulbifer rhizosphaerae TaxID=1562603 RepID=A0A7W4W9V9_9GAMM|nr:hypothetical protein [Microbulbifer rhizosphaerae]